MGCNNGQLPLQVDFNFKAKKESQLMVIGAQNTNTASTQRETNLGQVSDKLSSLGTDLNSTGKISKSDNSNQYNRNGFFIGPLKLKKSLQII